MKPKAHARKTDPATSREAAQSVNGITKLQTLIISLFKANIGGIHDEDLVLLFHGWQPPFSQSGIRSRRAELVRKGLIEDSGKRVKTASGRNAIVWRLA